MGSKEQWLIALSTSLIYGILVFFLSWEPDTQEHRPGMVRYSSRRINTSTTRTLHVDRSHSSGPDPPRCLWKVQFWKYTSQQRNQLEERYYCPESGCTVEYTHSSSYDAMIYSHVVVLHHRGGWDIEKINSVRRTDQIIAYMSRESPLHSRCLKYLGYFNWTITYNYRSEIEIPYGRVLTNSPTEEPSITQLRTRNWARGKKGLAIWIVSNCGTTGWPRTGYGKTLAKFMNIDIFGKCGKQKCGDKDTCLKRIYSYKFYIAFENSICQDYITEKFWRNALQHDAIPIVYGAPKSDYERLAPKNSFIHISDFSNMSSLAAYIDSLDKNDTLYNRYFEWRLDNHVEQLNAFQASVSRDTLCSISNRLVGNLKGSDVINSGDAERGWYKKSCGDVPRPKMV